MTDGFEAYRNPELKLITRLRARANGRRDELPLGPSCLPAHDRGLGPDRSVRPQATVMRWQTRGAQRQFVSTAVRSRPKARDQLELRVPVRFETVGHEHHSPNINAAETGKRMNCSILQSEPIRR